MRLMRRLVLLLTIALLCHAFRGHDQRASAQDTDLTKRISQLRAALSLDVSDRAAAATREATDRETTVKALIAIVNEESKAGGNHRLLNLAIAELGSYPEVFDAAELLVKMIDYEESGFVNVNPLNRFPAARALIKLGLPARRHVIGVGTPLSDEQLQLRSYVLAVLEQTNNRDPDSGRAIAVARLMRQLERVEAEVVLPEFEGSRANAVKNLHRMIAFVADPVLLAKQIPHLADDCK